MFVSYPYVFFGEMSIWFFGTGPCIKMKVLVADEEERNPARQNSAESTAEVILGMDRVPCGPGLF